MLLRKLALGLAGLCAVAVTGTAHAGERVMYQEITDNKPDVGVSTTVYLGDRMLEQRSGQWRECIVPKFNSLNKVAGFPFRVIDGVPMCKGDAREEKYIPPYMNTMTIAGSVKLKRVTGETFRLCTFSVCTDERSNSDLDVGERFISRDDIPGRAIEYNGRSGDVIRFTYLESTDAFVHQTATREFQIDLSQGNVAAYKGAVIEIENATNASITYKVVRTFQ